MHFQSFSSAKNMQNDIKKLTPTIYLKNYIPVIHILYLGSMNIDRYLVPHSHLKYNKIKSYKAIDIPFLSQKFLYPQLTQWSQTVFFNIIINDSLKLYN